MKKVLSIVFAMTCMFAIQSMAITKQDVEKGIQRSNSLVAGHNWHEAFESLRKLDNACGKDPGLRYMVAKQRYRLYTRINKGEEAKGYLSQMEKLANRSGDQATVEDMLLEKAAYYSRTKTPQVAQACYREFFERRAVGKQDDELDACFQNTIKEAKQHKRTAMASLIEQMYMQWQDSVAGERSAAQLRALQKKYTAAQDDIDSKATKITAQWVVILVLFIIAIALAAVMAFFMFLKVKNSITIKKLRQSLQIANNNSDNKSVFLRNISAQIMPSLNQIANGGGTQYINALQTMLHHVEEYMALETSREERYETEDINVEKVCHDVAQKLNSTEIPVTGPDEAAKMIFPVNQEAVERILTTMVNEFKQYEGTNHVTIAFKKRNTTTGNFIITAVGLKIPEEERDIIFTAFAKVYDLTITDGLTLPTCALVAYKMGGQISIDPSFAKGTRFIIEVKK